MSKRNSSSERRAARSIGILIVLGLAVSIGIVGAGPFHNAVKSIRHQFNDVQAKAPSSAHATPAPRAPAAKAPVAKAPVTTAPASTSTTCESNIAGFLNNAGKLIDANNAQPSGYYGAKKVIWKDPVFGGVTVGILSWNQNNGTLETLMQGWFDANPALFQQVFGSNQTSLLNGSTIKHMTFTAKSKLGKELQTALTEVPFTAEQITLINQWLVADVSLAQSHGQNSEYFAVLLGDLEVMIGHNDAVKVLDAANVNSHDSAAQAATALENTAHQMYDAHNIVLRRLGAARAARVAKYFSSTVKLCGGV